MDAEGAPLAILFAQLSGSAALYDALGNAQAMDAVGESMAGLRQAVEKHAGTVVKTAGDELIARFANADQALHAASAMQVWMRSRADRLAVQAGFTVGPVIQEKQDVFGDTVNVAARIAALANPKQILTTRTAVDHLSALLRANCRSLYSTTVKGKVEKIAIYEVMWHQDKGVTVVGEATMEPEAAPALVTLGFRGKRWTLDEVRESLAAGRDPTCEIVVFRDKVSRLHARIFLRHGKFVIADQSTNGTYVRMQHRAEILLNREEFVLLGSGSIGLGESVVEIGDDAISFQVG
jgi:class 3 adenylate cyclase